MRYLSKLKNITPNKLPVWLKTNAVNQFIPATVYGLKHGRLTINGTEMRTAQKLTEWILLVTTRTDRKGIKWIRKGMKKG